MKSAIEWFREHGFTFDDKITIKDVIDLQNDARKDGLMTAQAIASTVINRESPKYATPDQGVPPLLTLSGLAFFVTDAIVTEADKLSYLSGARRKTDDGKVGDIATKQEVEQGLQISRPEPFIERLAAECDALKASNAELREQLCANTKLISELQHTVRLVQSVSAAREAQKG